MKINLTIDATPEEVRRALGLPVMNDVHQAVMDQMSDQVKKGTVDPEKVMEMLGPSICLLYTSPSPRDQRGSRMPSSA